MRALFDGIPLEAMNTSMTINATAAWLLALYVAVAEEQGADRARLQGTVQNDIIKEYLSRGTYVFPPEPSLKLIADVAEYCYRGGPEVEPDERLLLPPAGSRRDARAGARLRARHRPAPCSTRSAARCRPQDFPEVVGRISFFVNAGIRFVTEMCKMRAFVDLWDEITATATASTDPKLRRFRYGVQVNSLGLTEQQPENNVYRILIEMLAVVLSKKARARAVQLPAWNEALGLPRPWDQQWSLRMQQIMAYETDLLEYGDLFDGNPAVEAKVEALKAGARAELARIDEMGGAVAAIDYMKGRARRRQHRPPRPDRGRRDRRRRRQPLHRGRAVAADRRRRRHPRRRPGRRGRAGRPPRAPGAPPATRRAVAAALAALRTARGVRRATSCPPRSPRRRPASPPANGAGHARGLRRVPRADRGRQGGERAAGGPRRGARRGRGGERAGSAGGSSSSSASPGLDGHSNGAEQIAVRARDSGMEVVYEGIRLTPAQIVNAALEESVHVVGLSILSGSHLPLVTEVMARMRGRRPRRRAGGRRRHHPRRRRRAPCAPPAWRGSTRRRTSS